MLSSIFGLLVIGVTVAAGIFSFGLARGFVRRRLRFVDSVRSPFVPILAAVGAALVILPLTIIPLVNLLVSGVTAAISSATNRASSHSPTRPVPGCSGRFARCAGANGSSISSS
jgi:uncharacterized protein involved in cysteine biosynthesis